jgi:hypothetical protein
MNKIELRLNEHKVLIFDAPENATHSEIEFDGSANYHILRKNNIIGSCSFDEENDEQILIDRYSENLINVGALNYAQESLVADLFKLVKNGHFYDYIYNGKSYISAISALRNILKECEIDFHNPYILIIKP